MARTLVIKRIIVAGRTFEVHEELRINDPNKKEVLDVYLAEKFIKYVDEEDGDYTYTFKNDKKTATAHERNVLGSEIFGVVKKTLEGLQKKTTTLLIINALNTNIEEGKVKESYKKGEALSFKVSKLKQKKETHYEKIKTAVGASMGNQVYLVAETKNLANKKVKVKIHEKGDELKLLKSKDDILPVLVYVKLEDKTTTTEANDWIAIDIKKEKGKKQDDCVILTDGNNEIEVGIKKIQLRPKADKMATKDEEASKSFEGWAEKMYIREDKTPDGKKAKEAEDKKVKEREAEKLTTLTRDEDADKPENKKSFPDKITWLKNSKIGKEAVYTITKYKEGETDADKNNIRWSLYIQGETKPAKGKKESLYINTKSKPNLYTYAKTELVDGKNQLTIIFDKALKGKKVQIEPFRGEPELNTKKDYVSTTLIKEKPIPKITKLDTTKLWLQTNCDECTIKEKEFLKGGFKLKAKPLWTNPVKDSEITLYSFTGLYKPRGSSFGNVRIRANGTKKPHTGLDIFAEKGTDIFACLDGIVERIYGESDDGSYGNVIVIEIDYVEYLIKSKNNYILKYKGEIEKGAGFNKNEKIYLRYAHVQKSLVKVGDRLKSGDKIGLSGVTGNATGTKAPHLHFEIANLPRPGKGLINRCNPAFYVNLKPENKADKSNQKEVSNTRHKI